MLLPILPTALSLLLITYTVLANGFVISDALLNAVRKHYGLAAKTRMIHWQQLMNSSGSLSEMATLNKVNDFFNAQRFVNDIKHWGKEDFWATPVEFLASGGGDCEDFSIAKYYTLRQLGIPDEKLRITYVMALKYNQAHMVLSYFPKPNVEPLILDNLNKAILPASQRQDLRPVYNFNGDGLWLARQRGKGKHIGKPNALSQWMQLRARFAASVDMTVGTTLPTSPIESHQ